MKRIGLFITILCFQLSLSAQETDLSLYKSWVKTADSLYQAKNYSQSAEAYAKGFAALNRKAYPNDRYNAACSYALAGEKDSALYHLNRIVSNERSINYAYTNYQHLKKDEDLSSLHDHPKWDSILQKIEVYKIAMEKNMDWDLKTFLDSIYEEDQGIRNQYFKLKSIHESDSDTMKAFMKEWRAIDSSNELAITQILDEHGWLGKEIVGVQGNTTLFLVIQHAKLETQEKYLPMMRQAVKDGKANGSSLALLEDRVLLRNGKKQIYGSQIGGDPETKESYVLPLEDPLNVNKRRASVGLPPIEEYIKNWDLDWNPNEYLKKLPRYVRILEEKNMNAKQ